jgi:Domain of unknown function (DUF4398)
MNFFPKSARAMQRRLLIVVPAIALFTAACASTPPIPTASLQAAQQSITNAERVQAGAHAPVELGEARQRLSAAQSAVSEKKMLAAERLADEARAEADLAVARTGAVKATAVNADMERSNATLIEEMQRKSGDNR